MFRFIFFALSFLLQPYRFSSPSLGLPVQGIHRCPTELLSPCLGAIIQCRGLLAKRRLKIYGFQCFGQCFAYNALHHRSQATITILSSIIRAEGHYCVQRVSDKVRDVCNVVLYAGALEGFRYFIFRRLSARGLVLLWQDAIRQLV